MFRGIAFDLEGTCIDLEILHFTAYEQACSDIGVSMSANSIARFPGAQGGGREYIIRVLGAMYPEKDFSSLYENKKKHFASLIEKSEIILRPGLRGVLESLKEMKIPLAIGSTTNRLDGERYMTRSGLLDFIPLHMTVFREDVSLLKPDAEVYIKTALFLGVEPGNQLVFEDTVPGVLAACAAGSKVIAVPPPYLKEETGNLIRAGAMKILDSWERADITGLF